MEIKTTCGKVIEIENEFLQYAMEKLIWKSTAKEPMCTSESKSTRQQEKDSAVAVEPTRDSNRS